MQGAKGVIISIIGGEDMKLLEVDEAANHIRELVDPEANIIWGSAFNPDLDGKIRVSVVATGIEQSAERRSLRPASRSSYGASRAPKKPVLPLPTEEELAEDAVAVGARASRRGSRTRTSTTTRRRADAYSAPAAARDPTIPSERGRGRGRRGRRRGGLAEPADDSQFGSQRRRLCLARRDADRRDRRRPRTMAADAWDDAGEAERSGRRGRVRADRPKPGRSRELRRPQGRTSCCSTRAAWSMPTSRSRPAGGRRRRMLGSGAGEDEAAPRRRRAAAARSAEARCSSAWPTSRAPTPAASDEDEEEEEGGGSSSLRIPRFLGRQNNQ